MGVFQTVLSAAIFVLDMIAVICPHVETLLLSILGLPSSITLRMFAELLETTGISGYPSFSARDARFARLVTLALMLIVPYLVSMEGRTSSNSKEPIGRLIDTLTKNDQYAAHILMLIRVW
jgi:hypothetical protein